MDQPNADVLFAYKPRSSGRFTLWFYLLGPVLFTIALIQEATPRTAGIMVLFGIIVWLFCIVLILLLLFVQKRMTRNNVIEVRKDGTLFGSFGGIKITYALGEFTSISVKRYRTQTRVWGTKRSDGREKLLMAFIGSWEPEQLMQFCSAVQSFGLQCAQG